MISERGRVATNGKRLATPQSVDAAVKAICDIMRRSNCAGALQYVPELTWLLFLRILDERETQEEERKRAVSAEIAASLESPFRWRDWAAPDGIKRKQLQNGTLGAVLSFVNTELLPHLQAAGQAGSLPAGTFVNAGAGVKTNLLFFTKGTPTERQLTSRS